MSMRAGIWTIGGPLLLVVVLVAAACGTGDTESVAGGPTTGELTANRLHGRQFWSTSVTVAGEERELVARTRIQVGFSEDGLGASAGCNSMGGPFRIEAGSTGGMVLVAGELAMTAIGCDEERHDQDQLVADLLSATPVVALEGDVLRLTAGEVSVVFLDKRVADPDRPIIGSRWTVTGFVDADMASAIAIELPGWITIGTDSSMSGFDGCLEFVAPVEVSDGSIGGPVAGDAELQFGPVTRRGDPATCAGVADYVDAFSSLFSTGEAVATIDGRHLSLVNGEGNGVSFVVDHSFES